MTMASTGPPEKSSSVALLHRPTSRRSLALGTGAREREQSSESWRTNNSVNIALMYQPFGLSVSVDEPPQKPLQQVAAFHDKEWTTEG